MVYCLVGLLQGIKKRNKKEKEKKENPKLEHAQTLQTFSIKFFFNDANNMFVVLTADFHVCKKCIEKNI